MRLVHSLDMLPSSPRSRANVFGSDSKLSGNIAEMLQRINAKESEGMEA